MIKHTFSALLLLAISAMPARSNDTDSSFVIKGYLAGERETKKIYLRYQQQVDSTLLENGHFQFKGVVSKPEYASLWLEEKDATKRSGNNVNFYVDPAEISIISMNSLKNVVVNGGPTESEQQLYNKMMEPIVQKRDRLNSRKYNNRDNEDSVLLLTKEVAGVNKESTRLQLDFVTRFPDSYVSFELAKNNSYAIDPNVLEPMLNALNPKFKNTPEVEDIIKRMKIARLTWIGNPALEFTQNDVNGKPVSLKSFRGKYVMIDFWASWCGWCRIEHPHLIKAYEKYKDKGFTILSVSLDDAKDKDKWIEAIKKDGLPWQQVCDLKGRDNEVAKMYGIKGIPQSVLIGPDGTIVAKNLRGDDLLVKLNELFGE